MASHLEDVLRLIEMGHLNQPFSSDVDVEMAMRAYESAMRLDRHDAQTPDELTARH